MAWDREHRNPHEGVTDPACRGICHTSLFVIGAGRSLLRAGRADAVCEGRLDAPTDRHDSHQGPDPLGRFARQGRGQKWRGVEEANPTFRPGLPLRAVEHRLGGHLALVPCVRREEKATLLVDACPTVCEPRQGPARETAGRAGPQDLAPRCPSGVGRRSGRDNGLPANPHSGGALRASTSPGAGPAQPRRLCFSWLTSACALLSTVRQSPRRRCSEVGGRQRFLPP
jgi:hypothetical protein